MRLIFQKYKVPYDICFAVLCLCDWPDLFNSSFCNQLFHDLVRKVLQQRIRSILLRFIPENHLPFFWTLLQSSRSCIMGGIVACAMMGAAYPSFHIDIAPLQMDLVVPADTVHPSPLWSWKRFLSSLEYRYFSTIHLQLGAGNATFLEERQRCGAVHLHCILDSID